MSTINEHDRGIPHDIEPYLDNIRRTDAIRFPPMDLDHMSTDNSGDEFSDDLFYRAASAPAEPVHLDRERLRQVNYYHHSNHILRLFSDNNSPLHR